MRIVEERIFAKLNIVELRNVVEERITGAGNEHLVARIAEEPKQKAVGFAGAGGETDVVDRSACSDVAVVARYGFTSVDHSERIGLILKDAWMEQGVEKCGNVVVESAMGWIGNREVE